MPMEPVTRRDTRAPKNEVKKKRDVNEKEGGDLSMKPVNLKGWRGIC